MSTWKRGWITAGALLSVSLSQLAAPVLAAEGAASPEAAVEALRNAEALPDVVRLIAPDERAVLSLTMIMATGMMVAFSQMGLGMAEGMAGVMAEDATAEEKAEAEAERQAAEAQIRDLEQRYEAVLARHGLTDLMASEDAPSLAELSTGDETQARAAELMPGVDHAALLDDLFALLESLGEEGSSGGGPLEELKAKGVGELEDLAIEGDRATATIDGDPVEFVRVDDRWYLSLGDMSE